MIVLPYKELRYYSFGLKAGVKNLMRNGFRLGAKRTVGKIAQPINWYTRFPEYCFFDSAIARYIAQLNSSTRPRFLDIGSPKTVGLYFAATRNVEVTLTDITPSNVDEYQVIWSSLSSGAKGRALFELQDARSLKFPDATFDVVYSMSVIEHIGGQSGDSQAVREMIRVLKPGGLLVISVPFGRRYMEQQIIGVSGAALQTKDGKPYFFQRIYDETAFTSRILTSASDLEEIHFITVYRKHTWMPRTFARLGENVRGAFGFLNPFLSLVANQSCEGMNTRFAIDYGSMHSIRDIYGDLVMSGVKGTSAQI